MINLLKLWELLCHRKLMPACGLILFYLVSTQAQAASLTINPNPCTIFKGQSSCQVNVNWYNTALSEIFVSLNGQSKQLFACGASGAQAATWIQAGNNYNFTMYKANNCTSQGSTGAPLQSVNVTAQMSANPPTVFHTLYYQLIHAAFWGQLADDTGASPTPRQLAIASINNNFKSIKALGFDTVSIVLPDNDSWPSQRGGGFSYNPTRNASPQFAVAQEIVARIAAANNLKVIFFIYPSVYRFSTDGRSAWNGLADQYDSSSNPQGAYDFIHSLIDPTSYYGSNLKTTKLSTIGLQDGPVHSFIGDPRVVGWLFNAEWNPVLLNNLRICPPEIGFKKYWNYFYNLVHWNGVNNAFAGTYVLGSPPENASLTIANIKAFKQWFAPGSGIIQPDLVGIEFYGATGYNLANMYTDLSAEVNAMENSSGPGDFNIAASKIYLAEGNVGEAATGAFNQYFQSVMQVLSDQGLAGINFFVSDSLTDEGDGAQSTLSSSSSTDNLFVTSYTPVGVRTYPYDLPSGMGWHLGPSANGSYADPTTFPTVYGSLSASYGQWSFTGPTDLGIWAGQAIATHLPNIDLMFYANPNPVAHTIGVTTLYWDLAHMTGVKTVQVRSGSITGPVLSNSVANGNSVRVAAKSGYQNYVLVDTTKGANNLLGTVTVEAQ